MLYDVKGQKRPKDEYPSLPIIRLDGVGKVYKLYHRRQDRFLEAIDIFNRNKTKYANRFHALRDIDLEIQRGETIGIIGRNGSGKSTLLSIIAGVIQPSFGRVYTSGRITSLLELGTGFNPELTGIENIYFHGTTSGLGREVMDQKREEIIAFADIGEYIEQPVKTYSSGMFVRLAFAVSICVNPDILIIDEALSVGDMQFQTKCMTAIDRIRKSGATVIFVAHDLGAIKSFCQRAVYLEKGRIINIGKAADIVEQYMRDMNNAASSEIRSIMQASVHLTSPTATQTSPGSNDDAEQCTFITSEDFDREVSSHRYGIGGVRIRYVELTDEQNQPIREIPFNSTINIQIHLESEWKGRTVAYVLIKNVHKIPICQLGFNYAGKQVMMLAPGDRRVLTFQTSLPLGEGIYSLEVTAGRPIAEGFPIEVMDGLQDAITFRMIRKPGHHMVWTTCFIPHTLNIQTPNNEYTEGNYKSAVHDNPSNP